MNTRLNAAQWERRDVLLCLAADVASAAALVRDEGRNLTADQRGSLELLIRASRVVREQFAAPPATPMPFDTLACAMEAEA
jgi:hypothetical protein